MKLNTLILLFSLTFSLIGKGYTQDIRVKAELGKDTILIGDQIGLDVVWKAPAGIRVEWPLFQDTLTRNVEIINKTRIDTSSGNGFQTLHQMLTITVFDSGEYVIPPIGFRYIDRGDTASGDYYTQALSLTVLTLPVDTSLAIKPIKGPISAPYTFREFIPWILGGIGLIIAVIVLLYFLVWKKKENKLPWIKPKPKLPPHVVALNDLEKLRHKKLWQAGKYKEYYTALTDILRIYMEDRFGIPAPEMTSFEIVGALKNEWVTSDVKLKLNQMLDLADLAKFAKEKPMPTENDKSQRAAEEFVKTTIKKEEEDVSSN